MSTVVRQLVIAAWVAASAGAMAHDHQHEVMPQQESAAAVAAPLAPVAARYDLKVGKLASDWYLWRDAKVVETATGQSGISEIWQQAEGGAYEFRRVFHADRRIIHYNAGEVRSRHMAPDWAKLSSVVSPAMLAKLTRGASKKLFDQTAVHYRGKVGDQDIDLWWLASSHLPAALKIVRPGETMTLTLREVRDRAPADWPRADAERIADYTELDAADLGDMENDPFVARVLAQQGHGHAH